MGFLGETNEAIFTLYIDFVVVRTRESLKGFYGQGKLELKQICVFTAVHLEVNRITLPDCGVVVKWNAVVMAACA